MSYHKVMADNSKSSGICLSDKLNPFLQAQFCVHSKSVKVQVLVNLCSYCWSIQFFLEVCFRVCFSFVTGTKKIIFLNTLLTSVLPHLLFLQILPEHSGVHSCRCLHCSAWDYWRLDMAEEQVGRRLQTRAALMNSLEVKGEQLNGGEHYLPFFLHFCHHTYYITKGFRAQE